MKKTLFLSSAVCIVLAGSMLFSACNKGGGINSEETPPLSSVRKRWTACSIPSSIRPARTER